MIPFRSRRVAPLGALLAGAALWFAAPAPAEPLPVVSVSSGLTVPAGIAETPDGALWVADDVLGVCRIRTAAPVGPVASTYCGDQHAGPVAASSLAFDAQTSSLYVADGASSGGAVWRLRWDAATGRLDGGTPIVRLPADRVTAIALVPAAAGPVPDVVYATKRSAAIMRIADPAGTPGAPGAVGFAPGADAPSLAHLDGHVYIADGSDVSRLALDAAAAGPAQRVPGLVGVGASSLAADPQRHRLYAGTTNGTLDDAVLVLDGRGTVERYSQGFAGVTGMTVGGAGDLLVADDPADAAEQLDPSNQGRIWRVALQSLARPSAWIEGGPAGATRTTSAAFAYGTAGGTGFECRLDDALWASCPGAPNAAVAYEGLADGVHRFEVRALSDDETVGAGVPARRAWVVDTRPPRLTVSAEAGDEVGGDTLAIDVLADEPAVALSCSVDGEEYWDCDRSTVLGDLAPGMHVVRVKGIDAAGNASDPLDPAAAWRFRVREPAPEPDHEPALELEPAPEPAPAQPAPPAPTVPAAAPEPAAREARTAVAGTVARRTDWQLRLRPRRFEAPAAGRRARTLRMTFRAPARARVARVTVTGAGRGSSTRRIAVRRLALAPGAHTNLRVRLTRAESRRLRPGLWLVSVSVGASLDRLGAPRHRWLRILPRPEECEFSQPSARTSHLVPAARIPDACS